MPKAPLSQSTDGPNIAEHTPPAQAPSGPLSLAPDARSARRSFTAWHHFLSRALDGTQEPGFTVESCVKLGELPLEADAIILHLDRDAALHLFRRHFDFLVPILRLCSVVEYKSPDARLELRDFDTVRAYSMLAKRKYKLKFDHDVSIAMLYSHTDGDFFADCATLGHTFEEIQPGILRSQAQPMTIYAVDLVRIGELNPRHPINLLSARRKLYEGGASIEELGPFAVLYDQIFLREIKQMSHHNTPGNQQILDDAERTFLASISIEKRLRGLPPEEILRRVSPEDRLRGLSHEEILRRVPAKDRLRGLPAEEIVRDLSETELARLRDLLLKSTDH